MRKVSVVVFLMLLSFTFGWRIRRPTRCEGKRDIVFLLDQSGSVGTSHFKIMLDTVARIVDHFNIGRYKTQVGVDLFSTNAKTVIKLKDYNSGYRLRQAIRNIRYDRGMTNTYKGLDRLRWNSFSRYYGRRYGVPKIAIVMTDGKSQNKAKTLAAARRARRSGITIFAIGIGRGIDYSEVRGIASPIHQGGKKKRRISVASFAVSNFKSLSKANVQNRIADMTCDQICF